MFDEPTVLVLGAGASAPYGFPLGKKLLSNITAGLALMMDAQRVFDGTFETDFINQPYIALAHALMRERSIESAYGLRAKDLLALRASLNTPTETVDEFIRINPQWRKPLKLLAALEIGRCFLEVEQQSPLIGVSRKFSRRFDNAWYSRLLNEMTRDAKDHLHLSENNLSIVTFNYDCSLQHYLRTELGRGEIFSDFAHENGPQIFPIHGCLSFGMLADSSPFAPLEFFGRLTSSINDFVVLDEATGVGNSNLREAQNALSLARRIFIFGFDFHQQNVDLIGLEDQSIASKCIVLNWDGSPRVTQRVTRFGIPRENIQMGSKGNPFEIAAALDDGLFEMQLS